MASIADIRTAKQPEPATVHWFKSRVERAKRGEVFGETIMVNPGFAGVLLNINPDNRSIKSGKVIQYASDMRTGRWTFNGEPILVSKDGHVNDGQHRLTALIDANICLPMVFVFGLDRDSRFSVDQGAARTAADYLSMDKVENATTASTIARLVVAYELAGQRDVEAKFITNEQVRLRVHSDPAIGESATFAVTKGVRTANAYVSGSMIGFCHYVFAKIDKNDAEEFLGALCSGANLKAGAPALSCRERMLGMGKARGPKAAVIFRAWNMQRRGVQRVKTNGLISILPLPALI